MRTEEEISSYSTMTDPWSLFLYGMKAPMTREKYRGRLAKFSDFIGLTEDTTEERANTFTEKGKKDSEWVFVTVLQFAQAQKRRVERVCKLSKLHNIDNKSVNNAKISGFQRSSKPLSK